MWKRIGFSRYAAEYWLLAKLITERISVVSHWQTNTAFTMEGEASDIDHDDATGTLLPNFDQSSMKQVNDLIVDLQKTTIHDPDYQHGYCR